ncbi:MAG: SusC/RagA family TonB-linked outer membrane protein, partial [Rubricoccaceae bacterium]
DEAETQYFQTLYDNPVALARENESQDVSFRVITNLFGEVDLAPGLRARVSAGLDNLNLRSRLYDSPLTSLGAGFGGRGIATTSNVSNTIFEGTLSYNGALGAQSTLSTVVGTSVERQDQLFESVTGTVFPTEEFRYITSAASVTQGSSNRTGNSLFSVFGRASYSFDDRYAATVNLRADGSSRFGEDNRFGFFPSLSLAWNVFEEDFFQSQNLVSGLRFRASYGQTGNQLGIGNFASRTLFGGASYAGTPGIAPVQLGNPGLSWESTTQFNVGTEFSVLDDRLGFSADYYVKDTDNLLVNILIPSTSGFTAYTGNVGSMRNVGFELTTRATVLRGGPGGVRWTAEFNAATNANEVTSLLDDRPLTFGVGGISRVEVGQPLGFFFGYQTDGLFQIGDPICRTQSGESPAQRNARCAAQGLAFQNNFTEPGDIRFVDVNGDGVINADDRTRIGNPWPRWTGGLTNTLGFRGVDVTAFLQFSYGNDIFRGSGLYTDAYGNFGANDNHTARALNRWRAPELDANGNPIPGTGNTNTTEPRASFYDDNQNARASSRFVEDGSYVRLKNLVVGYTLPARLAQSAGFRSTRVYAQAQNLVTITGYSGFDPEVNYAGDAAVIRGVDFYTLPQARTLTLGLTLGL